ncbi:hypothetical protein HYPSUDRAFT_1094465 [Hypholoma sublateritium FD-334 SS-4]|uniref:Uncharacterized protein n=1 Tax=Hypholoma sublateritium (strain FD-334 SS-4) TaxID=945553 RepID=A0A0D2KZ89_HYPSF|nr:hypothetical protein HYPSUDRAFT_1094465 [Hypholoma sublateritium FD-334 SS-4]
MCFLLPKFTLTSSRFVRAKYRLFEIWSPNSKQCPYYPGARDPDHEAGLLDQDNYLRCDGHLGRFDPTSCPQLFSPEKPWLGYIKNFDEPDLVEFSRTPLEWEPSGPKSMRGYMRTDYLHRLRQRQQEITQTMDSMARIQQGQAVDRMARAHRSLKHQDAWNRMAGALLHDLDHPIEHSDIKVNTQEQADRSKAPAASEPILGSEDELLPPAIATPGAGSWTNWIESRMEDNHTPCFQQIGSRRVRSVSGTCYFDRIHRRYLYFDEDPKLPSNYKANPDVWGQPLGIRLFVPLDGGVISEHGDLSGWMYRTERPECFDEGRVHIRRRSPTRLNESSAGRRSRSPFQRPTRYCRRARGDFCTPAEVIFQSPPQPEHPDSPCRSLERRRTRSKSRGRSRERTDRNNRLRRSEERDCPLDRPALEQARRINSRSLSPLPRRSESLTSCRRNKRARKDK